MREYDERVETIRNQGFITPGDVRRMYELGIPTVDIRVFVENFLKKMLMYEKTIVFWK